MKKHICFVLFLSLSVIAAKGQKTIAKSLPFQQSSEVHPLTSWENDALGTALSARLNKNPKWKSLIANKKMAIGLVDISNPQQPKFAQVNGNHMMYAASLPKIAILLTAMDALENGTLSDNEEIRTDLSLMIAKSDNQASTRMIDRLGFQQIQDVLTDPELKLYDKSMGGGLWVGKRYASQGKRNPDPIKGLSHAATATQVCRFYYLMAYGELINRNRSKEMLDIMTDPKLHHKFVNTLDQVAPKARLFRKSGSWKTYHSDSIMVIGPDWRQYILVALVDDPAGESIIRKLVIPIEEVLKAQK